MVIVTHNHGCREVWPSKFVLVDRFSLIAFLLVKLPPYGGLSRRRLSAYVVLPCKAVVSLDSTPRVTKLLHNRQLSSLAHLGPEASKR
jgi:hypothetical protein